MKIQIILLFLFAFSVCTAQTDRTIIQLNDSTSLELVKADFEPINKNIEYIHKNIAVGIDGAVFFGTDGGLPVSVLIEAKLTIGDKVYHLNVQNMYNPWFGESINRVLIQIKTTGNQSRLRGIFSDGAGTYGAEWLVIGNSHIRTILSKDEDILIGYFRN